MIEKMSYRPYYQMHYAPRHHHPRFHPPPMYPTVEYYHMEPPKPVPVASRSCGKRKPSYSSHPIVPHANDVLMGRGGKNNQFVGNEKLRDLAREMSDDYGKASKKEKSAMSRYLVAKVRQMTPPGRFLRRNACTLEWEDVGDDVAREKTSQVLRDSVSSSEKVKGSHSVDVPEDTASSPKTHFSYPSSKSISQPALVEMDMDGDTMVEEAKPPRKKSRRTSEPKANPLPEVSPDILRSSRQISFDLADTAMPLESLDELGLNGAVVTPKAALPLVSDHTLDDEELHEFDLFDGDLLVDEDDYELSDDDEFATDFI